MVVFESDPRGVTSDAHDARDALARFARDRFLVAGKDSRPQFGKDAVDVIRFASLRYDNALNQNDRTVVTRALAVHGTSITSWRTVANRTYAIAASHGEFDAPGARVDTPPVLVFAIRPLYAARLPELARAFAGPARPSTVIDAVSTADEVVVELQPQGRAIALALALVDAILAATPGRTIEPVLPVSDDVLAQYASLRLRDAHLDVSRVLDTYVERLLETAASGS